MKPKLTSFFALTTFVAAAFASTSSFAQTTWLMSVENPDGNYHTENAKQFAQDVAAATDGALEIDVHAGAELLKRPDLKRGVQTGVVQIGDITMSVLGNDHWIFELDSVPLLATSFEDAKKLWEVSRNATQARLAEDGLILIYAAPWPPQGIYTSNPIENVDSLAGVRFRTYNALTSDLASGLGASPVTVNPGEIPQAFSTGLISAMITSAATGVDYQAWDFVDNYYDVQAGFPKQVALMNAAAFEALPDDVQTAVLEAGAKAEARGWETAIAMTEGFNQQFRDNGMNVEPSPAVLGDRFSMIGTDLLNYWLEKSGDVGQQIIDAYKND